MKQRNCYECKKKLTWTDFMFKNYPHGQEYLESLWDNDYIKFYCCECFRKLEWNNNHEKYQEKLQIC